MSNTASRRGSARAGKLGARRVTPALAGLVAVAGVAAIGGTAASAAPHRAAAKKPTLVVYSAQGYDKAETTAFQKATGIPVTLDDNSTGPLLTQIEASRNNPKWDVLWVDGATAFATLDDQNMLLRGWEPNVKWNALGKATVPQDESFIPSGVTLMAAMVYNKTKVPNPPSSWQALESASWKGQIGMNDPSQSGPTYPFIAGMMNYLGSVAKGEAYFSTLKANGLVVNPTNGPTLSALGSGAINIALVQSSAGVGALESSPNLAIKYLNPVTLLPGCIGIDRRAPKAVQAEAQKFVEFVLSKRGQAVQQSGDPTGDSLYYPVVNGVKPLKALPALNGVKYQTINPYVWGPKEAMVNTWFDSHIVQ